MFRPDEREEIIRKIHIIGQQRNRFDEVDCIDRWLGEHQSKDWGEVLADLAQAGELIDLGRDASCAIQYSLSKKTENKEDTMSPENYAAQFREANLIREPFYMVYVDGKSGPAKKHFNRTKATREAERLCRKEGRKAYVLKAQSYCETTDITWTHLAEA